MKPITKRLRRPSHSGIFHNTREDVVRLAEMVNICIDKINELVDEVSELNRKVV